MARELYLGSSIHDSWLRVSGGTWACNRGSIDLPSLDIQISTVYIEQILHRVTSRAAAVAAFSLLTGSCKVQLARGSCPVLQLQLRTPAGWSCQLRPCLRVAAARSFLQLFVTAAAAQLLFCLFLTSARMITPHLEVRLTTLQVKGLCLDHRYS